MASQQQNHIAAAASRHEPVLQTETPETAQRVRSRRPTCATPSCGHKRATTPTVLTITSMWSQSAPASRMRAASSPRRAKSLDSMDGATMPRRADTGAEAELAFADTALALSDAAPAPAPWPAPLGAETWAAACSDMAAPGHNLQIRVRGAATNRTSCRRGKFERRTAAQREPPRVAQLHSMPSVAGRRPERRQR